MKLTGTPCHITRTMHPRVQATVKLLRRHEPNRIINLSLRLTLAEVIAILAMKLCECDYVDTAKRYLKLIHEIHINITKG